MPMVLVPHARGNQNKKNARGNSLWAGGKTGNHKRTLFLAATALIVR